MTFINLDAQIVSGTVDGGPQTVHVWLGEVQMYVETEGSGNWQADFSLDGNVLFPGACGNAEALEGPGSTIIDWCIANPHIEAFAWFDRYLQVDWPAGVPDEITIQNPDYQAAPLVPADPASTYDFLPGVDLQPGSIITASNGMTTKVLEISPLSASAEDATGFVTGVATPGRSFHMKTDFFFQANPVYLIGFVISLVIANFLLFVIRFITSFITFWSPEMAWGSQFLVVVTFTDFLSGAIFPLDIFPSMVQKVLYMTPFPYILFLPLQVYLGKVTPEFMLQGIATSIAWCLLTVTAMNMLWTAGLKTYRAEGR